jgi:hypothetical protein
MCSCNKNKSTTAGQKSTKVYVHTSPTGEQRTYKSEVEAVAATKRLGGIYRPA